MGVGIYLGDKKCDNSVGHKWKYKSGQTGKILACYEYYIDCDFCLENNSKFVVNTDGRLVIEDGCLELDGCLILDGCMKLG